MDIKQLAYFVEVAKQKSFTKASHSLYISQPTLSKMVKSLEAELDVELLDRSARSSELTDAGKIVYLQGEKILNMVDDLSSHLYDMMNLKKGHIKVGLPPLIGALYFPSILKGFQELYPDITIELMEHGANIAQQKILDGELDFAVGLLPVDETKFETLPFKKEELMLFVHSSHPFAEKNSVSISELRNEQIILFSEDFMLHDQMIEQCRQAGFEPHISYVSSQWDFISDMVSHNLGVTFFPKSILTKINQNNVISIPLVNPEIPWDLGIILRKEKYISYASRAFINYIKSAI
ncbi:LysR family transcriptional regulator [Bacillus sp. es.036]|uniref:LysR family transcriptional regulator n=1 Tax=Bacillus sp. es.036 TaxID=1761764 RepID=UPI000BF6C788|nr:LysR family transcriptional regulator [Bacillus sp. es.036]PFG14757.1 DNA-binding transcriptional LysR family regulator [Bacillus sp. es.036]